MKFIQYHILEGKVRRIAVFRSSEKAKSMQGFGGTIKLDELINFSKRGEYEKIALDDLNILFWSASHGLWEILEIYLNNGVDVNFSDDNKFLLLHYAVSGNQIDTVAFLVERGATLEKMDNRGITPLQFAEIRKNKEIADFLRARSISDD